MARFELATLPTSLTAARRLQAVLGGPLVWVKRDDLTGFATAGNKARSLEFLVGDALAQDCDVLVTGGGASSNFCAAAAAAARAAGLDCDLVLYGSAPGAGHPWHPNLRAAVESGAHVQFTGRPDRDEVDQAVPERGATLAAQGRRPYVTPRGGATAVGAVGFALAFDELAAQLDEQGIDPGLVVVATGSGGTQAGLVAGRAATGGGPTGDGPTGGGPTGDGPTGGGPTGPGPTGPGLRPRILGATVSRPPAQIHQTVVRLAHQCGALLGLTPPPAQDVEIVDARGPGFGVASERGERARQIANQTEGLLLDPVYSAKAFAVVLDLIADGFDQPIVFWHTAGLPAAIRPLPSERSALCPT